MRWITRRRAALPVVLASFAALSVAAPSGAGGAPPPPDGWSATAIPVESTVTGFKSASARLVESDPALLGRSDSTRVNVVVKLDYDATASYAGGLPGLSATSPRVTGRKLTGRSPAEVAYERYTGEIDAAFRAAVSNAVPAARVGHTLQRVYGGVAMSLPANQVGTVLALPNVVAVMSDTLNKPQTDSSTTFIGAPTIWAQNGGQELAGNGVIFGDLDTGLWPEHPSFADNPALGDAPPAPDGQPRTCDFGDNPLTPAVDVFQCNHKLIGGEPFLDTYNAVFGGEVFPDSARDSNGHGTHTTSTAAGNIVDSAPIFGIERGPISGVAPGAWVIEYKVCGFEGCFGSDSAAAVQAAILDGVSVINFSISGGTNPYNDPAELAFLDAYAAGVLVSASAGNSGPGAGTTSHVSPWTVTVAASTQTREFQSTLTLTDGADSVQFVGSSITHGVPSATPVVFAQNLPGYTGGALCLEPVPAGLATGKIVACQRGPGRAAKGFNVLQGGAVGMILYNATLQDTETDNHWLPTVHLADGTDFVAFLTAHPSATATFTDGVKGTGVGDVMANFSSRGPGGQFLKPDITAPGVQILAGHSPVPDDVAGGPPGEYFQAIAGTSMSSPHVAGSALLLRSLHPDWSPGATKSALMTTALQSVVKEDGVTPADPFDYGSGRVDLTKAGDAKLVIDESAADMFLLGSNPLTAAEVNTPTVNVPEMPGAATVHRTLTNVTGSPVPFKVSTSAPAGSSIAVVPAKGEVLPGGSVTLTISISSNAPTGQYFGEIRITSTKQPAMHVPVGFFNTQGEVSVGQACDPGTIPIGASSTCTVTIQNNSFSDTTVSASTRVSTGAKITGATGATIGSGGSSAAFGPELLSAQTDPIPAIAPGNTPGDGYLDLELFGIAPIPVSDEQALNFNVPTFQLGGKTYSRLGIVSNGYIVMGGTTGSADIQFTPQTLPDPARPNGVLAPFWTDLDGAGSPGVRIAILTDGVNSWIVAQWNVHLFGSAAATRAMQVWIGVNGVDDISYAYHAGTIGTGGTVDGLTVGAENDSGTAGAQITGPPTGSYVITATPGAPGESATYTLTVMGLTKGTKTVTTDVSSDIVFGTTRVTSNIIVTK